MMTKAMYSPVAPISHETYDKENGEKETKIMFAVR